MSNILTGNIVKNGLGYVKATIDGILFNKIKGTTKSSTLSRPPMPNANTNLWVNNNDSLNGITGMNAVDIDWNGAQPEENVTINSTGELLTWIKNKVGQKGDNGKSTYEIYVENTEDPLSQQEWLASLKGDPGNNGTNGKSAYELAVDNGYEGTIQQWLASLKGQDGTNGTNGQDGQNGNNGTNGKSAYELAVDNGYEGTIQQWLASLKGDKGETGLQGLKGDDGNQGPKGDDGKSTYDIYCENTPEENRLNKAQWLASLKGDPGNNGTNGKSAYELAVDNGYEGTIQQWLDSLKGQNGTNGQNGQNGTNGKSAYELAVDNGYEGTIKQWLASLKGETGTFDSSDLEDYATKQLLTQKLGVFMDDGVGEEGDQDYVAPKEISAKAYIENLEEILTAALLDLDTKINNINAKLGEYPSPYTTIRDYIDAKFTQSNS